MITYESELMHHGVKGMKWGVRRYQNKDGTLNSKGKKKLAAYKKYKTLSSSYDKAAHKANSYWNVDEHDGPMNAKAKKLHSEWGKAHNTKIDFYNANRKDIKAGRKIAAKLGDKRASFEYHRSKQYKQKAAAIGAGVIGALAFKKAIKNRGVRNSFALMGDVGMAQVYHNKRNRALAAGIIASSAAITLGALSKRNKKKADDSR